MSHPVLYDYIPLLILFVAALLFTGGTFLASALLGRRKVTAIKSVAYECGMLPVHEANRRVSVKYYMVAISFVLFDMEAIFLLPWPLVFRNAAVAGGAEHLFAWQLYTLVVVGFFVLILALGLVYEWGRGALRWD